MPTVRKLKPKELRPGHLVRRPGDHGRDEWHTVQSVSDAERRHGDEGGWVYRLALVSPKGRRWTSVISASSREEVRQVYDA